MILSHQLNMIILMQCKHSTNICLIDGWISMNSRGQADSVWRMDKPLNDIIYREVPCRNILTWSISKAPSHHEWESGKYISYRAQITNIMMCIHDGRDEHFFTIQFMNRHVLWVFYSECINTVPIFYYRILYVFYIHTQNLGLKRCKNTLSNGLTYDFRRQMIES